MLHFLRSVLKLLACLKNSYLHEGISDTDSFERREKRCIQTQKHNQTCCASQVVEPSVDQ